MPAYDPIASRVLGPAPDLTSAQGSFSGALLDGLQELADSWIAYFHPCTASHNGSSLVWTDDDLGISLHIILSLAALGFPM